MFDFGIVTVIIGILSASYIESCFLVLPSCGGIYYERYQTYFGGHYCFDFVQPKCLLKIY